MGRNKARRTRTYQNTQALKTNRNKRTPQSLKSKMQGQGYVKKENALGYCMLHQQYVDAGNRKLQRCLICNRLILLKKEGIEIMKKENEFVVKMAFKKMKLCINTKSCKVSFDNEKTWNWTSSNLLDEGTKVLVRDENDNIVQKEVKDITNIFWEGVNYPILKED